MRFITKEQIQRRLVAENPWWKEPNLPSAYSDYEPRAYLDLFWPLISDATRHRAVVLLGPRRVGKTVMIHHAIGRLLKKGITPNRILYCSIDSPIYNHLGLEDLLHEYADLTGADLSKDHVYVFFDEIQYLKEWERHLKSLVDLRSSLRFCVSGSAAAALKLKSHESGAGRFTDFLLPPLTFYEYLVLLRERDLVQLKEEARCDDIERLNHLFLDYINFGGYPEIALSKELQADPGRFIKNDIIDKVLLRDLPSLYGIQDIQELNYLFTTLAFNTANEVSLESLSKSSGVAKNTIKRYIEYLEAAFLIRTVHRVDRNAKRFKRANYFKVYLTNPSIRSALFAPVTSDDPMMGDLVETALFSQWFHYTDTTLFYARWGQGKDQGEVDIVYLNAAQKAIWAVEAKWSDRFFKKPEELKSLAAFCKENPMEEPPLVTTITKKGERTANGLIYEFSPASLYCYMVGANAIKNRSLAKPLTTPAAQSGRTAPNPIR